MVTNSEYLERFKKIRAKRVRSRAGKDLIFDEDRMIRALVDREVPTMMQHCILRVHPKMVGNDKERFLSAFNICAAVFQKNGYMRRRSFKMTGKGIKNNRRHQRETEAAGKRNRYIAIVNRLWRASMDRLRDKRKK